MSKHYLIEWRQPELVEWYATNILTMDKAEEIGRQLLDTGEKVSFAVGLLFVHVDKHEGGRGLEGGRRELARRLGIAEPTMRRYIDSVKGRNLWNTHIQKFCANAGADLIVLDPTKYALIQQAPRPDEVIEYTLGEVKSTGKPPSWRDMRQFVKIQIFEDKTSHLATLPKVSGQYEMIVIDPPWPRRDYDWDPDPDRTSWQARMAFRPYPPMTLEAIKELEIPAAKNCVLWLWITNHNILALKEVLEAWGFEYKCMLTWVKNRLGTGYWLRGQTEHCALAIRGEVPWQVGGTSTVLNAPVREDSRKPDEFYALAESLAPWASTKLDMFSRENRNGWDQWGDECDKFTEEV